MRCLQAKDPCGNGVHQHGNNQGNHADHAQSGGLDQALLFTQRGPQVHAGQNQVRSQHNDVPHQRRGQVRVQEQLPNTKGLAQVNHNKADSHHGSANGGPHSHLRNAAEAFHAESARNRADDQATCRQTNQEHKHGNVQAPRVKVAHARVHHAADQLKHPQTNAKNGNNGRHGNSDVHRFTPELSGRGLLSLFRHFSISFPLTPGSKRSAACRARSEAARTDGLQ